MNLIKNFSVFNGAYYLARFADQGLSNALGLATLRHGTNPYSWLSIHIKGADPSYGAVDFGGDFGMGFDAANRNSFFVAHTFSGRSISKTYAFRSSQLLFKKIFSESWASVGANICWFVLPNIKFRFSDYEVGKWFQDDPSMTGVAKFTRDRIYPWRIGVIGTVWASLTPYTIVNMCTSPIRVITGVAQLAFVGIIAFYVCPYMKSFKVAAVAGVILAII